MMHGRDANHQNHAKIGANDAFDDNVLWGHQTRRAEQKNHTTLNSSDFALQRVESWTLEESSSGQSEVFTILCGFVPP